MAPPTSPHLQVYRLPLTAILSISHRISGIIAFVISLLLVWRYFFLIYLENSIIFLVLESLFSGVLGKLTFLVWSGSIYYHFCNGIRHILWDFGKFFSLRASSIINYIVIGTATLLFALTWVLI